MHILLKSKQVLLAKLTGTKRRNAGAGLCIFIKAYMALPESLSSSLPDFSPEPCSPQARWQLVKDQTRPDVDVYEGLNMDGDVVVLRLEPHPQSALTGGMSPRSRAAILQFPRNAVGEAGDNMHESGEKEEPYIGVLRSQDDILHARQLVARVYFKNEYIAEANLTNDGCMDEKSEPWVAHSDYYGYKVGDVMGAACRSIKLPEVSQYPAISVFDGVDVDVLAQKIENAEHVKDPNLFEEISALGSELDEMLANHGIEAGSHGVVKLYAAMMKDTIKNRRRYLLMSVDARVARKLGMLFGAENFTALGEAQHYMGSTTIPMVLDSYKVYRYVRDENTRMRPEVRRAIQSQWDDDGLDRIVMGADGDHRDGSNASGACSPDEGESITCDSSDDTFDTAADRLLADEQTLIDRRFKTALNAGKVLMLGLAIGKTLALLRTPLVHQGVNPLAFFITDAATIEPWARGYEMWSNRHNGPLKRLGGLAMFGASVAAPYAYTILAGGSENLVGTLEFSGGILGLGLVARRLFEKITSSLYRRKHQQEAASTQE